MGVKLNKIDKDYEDNLDGLEDKGEEQRELQDDMTMLLHNIIKELKIMNLHLSFLTDNNITKQEVE